MYQVTLNRPRFGLLLGCPYRCGLALLRVVSRGLTLGYFGGH